MGNPVKHGNKGFNAHDVIKAAVLTKSVYDGIKKISQNMPGGASSSGKATETLGIESKDATTGRTYTAKTKTKKQIKRSVKNKKKAKRFENKVMKAVKAHTLGTKVVNLRDVWTNPLVTANSQGTSSMVFFGNHPTTFGFGRGYRDLRRLMDIDGFSAGTGAKFNISSVYGTVTLMNNNQPQFFVDIYEIANKVPEETPYTMDVIWSIETTNSGTQTTGTPASTTDIGMTPFQSPLFMQKFTVSSKVTIALGTNETYKFEVRRKRNVRYDFDKTDFQTYLAPTFGYLFIYYGRPQYDSAIPASYLSAQMNANSLIIASTRHYAYHRSVVGPNGPSDSAIAQIAS